MFPDKPYYTNNMSVNNDTICLYLKNNYGMPHFILCYVLYMYIHGNTLQLRIDSGNIGHSFNDHLYAEFAYYLKNLSNIDNIYVITELNKNIKSQLLDNIKNKCFFDGNDRGSINMSFFILFFMFENKLIITNDMDYEFENLIEIQQDRFFHTYNNYIEVFLKSRDNYKKYISNNITKIERVDVTVLYRENSIDRNMLNLEQVEFVLKKNNIGYSLFKNSLYNFENFCNAFYFSDNIISIYGCELTFGIFLNPNCTIIELTPNNHIESWWRQMGIYYENYGLNYKRRHYESHADNNLFFDEKIIDEIMSNIKIKNLIISY